MDSHRIDSSSDDDRGAIIVEFALIVPILLVLLIGIINFGVAYNTQITLQGAAREGAASARSRQQRRRCGECVGRSRHHGQLTDGLPGWRLRRVRDGDHQQGLHLRDPLRADRHEDPVGDREHAMRTLNDQSVDQRDEGAVLIWVALMLVVLLGVGALVIDIGRLYVERRELQNGADAAALAVAQDCAAGSCEDEGATAQDYADLNANDGTSAIEPGTPCGNASGLPACADDGPDGLPSGIEWVRVGTSTLTSSGDDEVSFLLAPIMSALSGKKVRASATAAWGALGGGPVTPLVFSQCEWEALGGSIGAETFPSGVRSIEFQNPFSPGNKDPESCTLQAGQDLPGGFGRVDAINCNADFTQGGIATVDPGNDLARGCPLEEWRNNQVLIAIYGPVGGEPASREPATTASTESPGSPD